MYHFSCVGCTRWVPCVIWGTCTCIWHFFRKNINDHWSSMLQNNAFHNYQSQRRAKRFSFLTFSFYLYSTTLRDPSTISGTDGTSDAAQWDLSDNVYFYHHDRNNLSQDTSVLIEPISTTSTNLLMGRFFLF